MAQLKKVFLLSFALLTSQSAFALRLKYLTETSLPTGMKFKNTQVGGLSGMAYASGSLSVVSDDRGKFGEPRFYRFELSLDKNKVTLKPQNVRFVTDLPGEKLKLPFLDLEGLVLLPNGNFILSSEGNNNTKPRQMPRLFEVNDQGRWQSFLPVADVFLPEATGKQEKGIQNNAGFEGLTLSSSGNILFAAVELPLAQEGGVSLKVAGKQKSDPESFIRMMKYEKEDSRWAEKAQYAYALEPLSSTEAGAEIFRGVSEILSVSDHQLLVLERGVRVLGKDLYNISVAIFEAELPLATNVQSLAKLSDKDFVPVKKTKILDFETDLKSVRAEKKVQNFEALSWGPTLPDGRKTLLVLSDNNFSKKEITELLVFTVEEDSK